MEEGVDEPSIIRGNSHVNESQAQPSNISQLGRKRASSSKDSDAKKMKVVMNRLVDAIDKPLRLENVVIRRAQDSWLENAMEVYAKDFSWNHIRVERRLKRKWIQDPHTALEFASGTHAYRLDIVESAALAVGQLRSPPGEKDSDSDASEASYNCNRSRHQSRQPSHYSSDDDYNNNNSSDGDDSGRVGCRRA